MSDQPGNSWITCVILDGQNPESRTTVVFNLIAFWFFGLCNNYGYVVMLSAAEDILAVQENSTDPHVSEIVTCTVHSTPELI